MNTRILHSTIVALLLAGCSSQRETSDRDVAPRDTPAHGSTLPHDAPPIVTSAASYQLRRIDAGYAADIPYTYTNRSGAPLYLVNCNGDVAPGLERQTGDGWERAWLPETNGCLSPAVVIPAGGSYSDTLHMVVAPWDSTIYRELGSSDTTRRYRLLWHQAFGSFDPNARPFGVEVPREQRSSNAFALVMS